MSFMVRPAEMKDLDSLCSLSKQFALLNLPPEKDIIEKKLRLSESSFSKKIEKISDAQYVFVLEDMKEKKVVGCSMIIAKHGSEAEPHFSFKLVKEEKHSEDLGVGFVHHLLRLSKVTDGPTEIGGLLLDRDYRKEPSKLGRLVSLSRFLFMSMKPDLFQEDVLCEFAPLLGPEGQSYLWEELGRKFTGLTYEDADRLSIKSKEFIHQLFPIQDIYLSLFSADVRQNLGRVSVKTEPAKHMLEKLGFKYLNEMDPFDGGPHFGTKLKNIRLVDEAYESEVTYGDLPDFSPSHLASVYIEDKFYCVYGYATDNKIVIDNYYQEIFKNTKKLVVGKL